MRAVHRGSGALATSKAHCSNASCSSPREPPGACHVITRMLAPRPPPCRCTAITSQKSRCLTVGNTCGNVFVVVELSSADENDPTLSSRVGFWGSSTDWLTESGVLSGESASNPPTQLAERRRGAAQGALQALGALAARCELPTPVKQGCTPPVDLCSHASVSAAASIWQNSTLESTLPNDSCPACVASTRGETSARGGISNISRNLGSRARQSSSSAGLLRSDLGVCQAGQLSPRLGASWESGVGARACASRRLVCSTRLV
mmetsp:Transcript_63460/g.147892  ORF Transcript_63460/g.147892 Transcript_63460/m.147892 type:complete len:262 (-) Transcript_63460:1027-1812(-)